VVRLLTSENPRWWLAIGATAGVGLQTKYAIGFFIAGILGGMLLTPARRYFATKWFWAGVAMGAVIFLPNLIWQFRHDLISLTFLQHIHARDVGEGRADGFLRDQFVLCTNLFAAPLWIAGLVFYFRDRRYRMLGWMYVITLALFVVARGRGYYTAGAYPMLIAMGAVAGERWVASLTRWQRRTLEAVYFTGLAACGLLAVALVVPVAADGPIRDFALNNNGDLREETGWEQMVQTVASIRDSLTPEQREHYGVVVGNYGEQGAIELLGRSYGLPTPISTTNSAWLRGYPMPPPETLIVLGNSRKDADEIFTGCRLAGHIVNPLGLKNEETQYHPDIFVCGPPREPWPVVWKKHRNFG
jgi:4-amino-4-deoxy-L-arabinose transferase-like glycosyltransferase